mmetsp:Transcript_11460/g.27218  ORF Transcript_11460/g.27218 Transcript_11460/m.27218 type:complete len:322 (-) Transcript_11460:705-1670(-)
MCSNLCEGFYWLLEEHTGIISRHPWICLLYAAGSFLPSWSSSLSTGETAVTIFLLFCLQIGLPVFIWRCTNHVAILRRAAARVEQGLDVSSSLMLTNSQVQRSYYRWLHQQPWTRLCWFWSLLIFHGIQVKLLYRAAAEKDLCLIRFFGVSIIPAVLLHITRLLEASISSKRLSFLSFSTVLLAWLMLVLCAWSFHGCNASKTGDPYIVSNLLWVISGSVCLGGVILHPRYSAATLLNSAVASVGSWIYTALSHKSETNMDAILFGTSVNCLLSAAAVSMCVASFFHSQEAAMLEKFLRSRRPDPCEGASTAAAAAACPCT